MRIDVSGMQVRLDDELIKRHASSGVWQDQTIAQLARQLVERDPSRVTHVFEGRPWTIGELLDDAESLAANLQSRGFRAGDVVSFQLPNWVEAMIIDLAAAILGLVVVPIITIYREAEAAYMLADCGAKAVFVPGEYRGYDYLAMMQRLAPQLPKLEVIVPVRVKPVSEQSYESLVGQRLNLRDTPTVDANAIKMLLYTSGTTGRPKGVLHSHNTLAFSVSSSGAYWGLGAGDTTLMASPVTHVTGFGCGLEMPLLCDMKTIFMERWNAAEGVALIENERINFSVGATPFLQELLAEADRTGSRLPSLRVYACGGAAVPPALIDKANSMLQNCRTFRVFGSSEVPLVSLGFLDHSQRELAAQTDGKVVHYEVRIVDDEGHALNVGHEGEIVARGPAMCLGYADPGQTAESFDAEGYFHTGDLGCLGAQNSIVVTGRKKDLINRGGEKISAKEVEDVLHRHPDVEEAAAVAMPHPRLGETVCVYVIPKSGHQFDFERLTSHMSASGIAKQKWPERLEIVEALPRTASGKIRKDQLRKDILDRVNTN